jgi:hypothetical protein
MLQSWAETQAMSDEELIVAYDKTAGHTSVGLEWIRDELTSRALMRAAQAQWEQAEEIRTLTRTLTTLTRWIAALTAAAVVVAIVAATIAIVGN